MIWPFYRKAKLPKIVRLDSSTLCQLNCRGCYMRKYNYGGMKPGYLKFEDFVKFLNMNPFVEEVGLACNGEMFLNPDLMKIIQYGHKAGIRLSATAGTNFNDVSDEMLEALVKYNFRRVHIALDGASQKVYSWYRRGGNFDKVIANIKRLNYYKKRYNSAYPELGWQYVIFPSNDNKSEVSKAKKMAEKLGMHMFFRWDYNGYMPKDPKLFEKEDVIAYRSSGFSHPPTAKSGRTNLACSYLWDRADINWDGRLMGCAHNYRKDFGINVFKVGLEKALNSKIVRDTKKMLMGGKPRKDSPCYECEFYRNMAATGEFVAQEELKGLVI